MLNTRSGFTLIEIIVAMTLFAVVAASAIVVINETNNVRSHQVEAAQTKANKTFQQHVALQGIDPLAVTSNPTADVAPSVAAVNRAIGGRTDIEGRTPVASMSAISADQTGRAAGMGFQIETDAVADMHDMVILIAPQINYNGQIQMSWFPIVHLVTIPLGNPPGTVYRYTIDGSMPTEYSPIWDRGTTFTSTNIPASFKIKAFHSDSKFVASPVAEVEFALPSMSLVFQRHGKSDGDYGWTYTEIADHNIEGSYILTVVDSSGVATGMEGMFDIITTLNGVDAPYSGWDHPPHSAFAGGSATFSARGEFKNPNFVHAPIVLPEIEFVAEKIQLNPPTIDTAENTEHNPNETVTIEPDANDIDFAQTLASLDGGAEMAGSVLVQFEIETEGI